MTGNTLHCHVIGMCVNPSRMAFKTDSCTPHNNDTFNKPISCAGREYDRGLYVVFESEAREI